MSKFLYEKYVKKTADVNTISFTLSEGLVDLDIKTNSVITNHLIFSYAFSKFYERHKKGRGKVYIADTCLQECAVIGYLTGVVYWFFHRGVV